MPHINEIFDFTVSMFLIHPTEPKICLHYHEKLKLWNNFGGHIELNQDPLECLEQEMLEETGLRPKEYTILETHDAPKNVGVKKLPNPFGLHMWKYAELQHWHIDLPYVIKPKHTKLHPNEGESKKIKWFTLDEIVDYSTQGKVDEGTLSICSWIANKFL